ncbi:hypothetical protein [Rugamonas sp. DEMB1]|uniref:flagellin N-terminal helical domain-containing protein n=1 Tax=Rugamonas sp. DEMB1 TaxID=3039386 RepID=UPI0024496239|nr:hypothetical protein [Rugamonas sp. DEMB1]WGG50897.1 hypothetical protein QC826_00865 [Rugamonas sp. DEMB1]
MLSLHTNTASLSALSSLGRTEGRMAHAMTRLGTGYRVNSAMDDAAGLQIATRLSAQSHGMAAAMGNIQKSLSMLQSAEGALDESGNILVRMNEPGHPGRRRLHHERRPHGAAGRVHRAEP